METWTLPERHLVTELAVGMARRLEQTLGPASEGADPPGYLWHMAQSAFEYACDVLWRLDAARAADAERSELTIRDVDANDFPAVFRPLPADEIRAVLARDPPADPARRARPLPSLDEVIGAYIGLVSEYGPDMSSLLSTGRKPFIPPGECAREIDALERLGYVVRDGSAVRWTDKMAPAMKAENLWQADDAAEEETELAAALAATPEHTRRVLAAEAKRLSELEFMGVLMDRFDGLYRTTNPDGTPRPQGGLLLMREVYKYLRTNS